MTASLCDCSQTSTAISPPLLPQSVHQSNNHHTLNSNCFFGPSVIASGSISSRTYYLDHTLDTDLPTPSALIPWIAPAYFFTIPTVLPPNLAHRRATARHKLVSTNDISPSEPLWPIFDIGCRTRILQHRNTSAHHRDSLPSICGLAFPTFRPPWPMHSLLR